MSRWESTTRLWSFKVCLEAGIGGHCARHDSQAQPPNPPRAGRQHFNAPAAPTPASAAPAPVAAPAKNPAQTAEWRSRDLRGPVIEVLLRNSALRSREISSEALALMSAGAAEASAPQTNLPNRCNIHRLRPGTARVELRSFAHVHQTAKFGCGGFVWDADVVSGDSEASSGIRKLRPGFGRTAPISVPCQRA